MGTHIKILYKGKPMNLLQISKLEKINYDSLRRYYIQLGDIDEAVKTCKQYGHKLIEYKCEMIKLSQIAKKENISYHTLRKYYNKLGDIHEAVIACLAISENKSNVVVNPNGTRILLQTIAKHQHIDYCLLKRFYKLYPDDLERAINICKENKLNKIDYNGDQLSIAQISAMENVPYEKLKNLYEQTNDIYSALNNCRDSSKHTGVIQYGDTKLTIPKIAKLEGVDNSTLRKYYYKTNDIYSAVELSKANKRERSSRKLLEYNGELMSISKIAKLNGICHTALIRSYNKTNDIHEAVSRCKDNKENFKNCKEHKLILKKIADNYGIKYYTLMQYYSEDMDIDKVIELIIKEQNLIRYNNKLLTLNEIAKFEGINRKTLSKYYNEIHDIKQAVLMAKDIRHTIENVEYNNEIVSLPFVAKNEGINYNSLLKCYKKTRDLQKAIELCKYRKALRHGTSLDNNNPD